MPVRTSGFLSRGRVQCQDALVACVFVCVLVERGMTKYKCMYPQCDDVFWVVIFSSIASLPLLLTDSIHSVGNLNSIVGIPDLHRATASAHLGDYVFIQRLCFMP